MRLPYPHVSFKHLVDDITNYVTHRILNTN